MNPKARDSGGSMEDASRSPVWDSQDARKNPNPETEKGIGFPRN